MIAFYFTKYCQTVCFKTDRNVKKLADATAFLGIKNEKMISLFELLPPASAASWGYSKGLANFWLWQ